MSNKVSEEKVNLVPWHRQRILNLALSFRDHLTNAVILHVGN